MTSIGPPRRCARPAPSVTKMVWPFGCVCQAVRAPGVKWTLVALRRDDPAGVATASRYTAPVNHSLGPAVVLLSRVIFMSLPPFQATSLGSQSASHMPDYWSLPSGQEADRSANWGLITGAAMAAAVG